VLRGRLNHEFRHEAADDADGSDTPDVCLFADLIMPSAERAGNDRPVTLLTKEMPRDEDDMFRCPQRPSWFHSTSSAV
jgi:hypothetical protein